MREIIVETRFEYTNKSLPNICKKFLEKKFLEVRDIAVDELNILYRIWNEEYDAKFPDVPISDTNHELYDKWIDQKAIEAFKDAPSFHTKLLDIRFDHANEGIYGYSPLFRTEIRMHVTIPQNKQLL